MNHSPAPWRYCSKTGQIVDANNRQIARVWFTSNYQRNELNGELIAMAPYLKDALRKYAQVFGHLGSPDEAGNAIHSARDELEEALALCVEALDSLVPHLARIPADIGFINDALTKARPLVEVKERHDPAT